MKKTNRCSKQVSPVDASSSAPEDNQNLYYEERIRQLQQTNEAFQKEVEELRGKLANVSSASSDGVEKLKVDYLQKLNVLEEQVTELKKKQNVQSQLSTQRPKGNEATKRLQFEIQSLKAQKVQLQCKVKLESVQFRLCKASLEKEVLQLRKEGRRNEYEMQKLFTSNQRLKRVLQRKTEEASMATKRLRELLESRKTLSHRSSGARVGNIPGSQVLNGQIGRVVEHELEVTARLHELCSEYEHQMEEMANEVAKLKKEAEVLKQENLRCPLQEKEIDFLEKDVDMKDLKEQVASLSDLLRQLQVQKAAHIQNDKSQDGSGQASFSVGSSNRLFEDRETSESDHFTEANISREKSAVGLCCSCSKKSLCKTTKCRCRTAGGSCGKSCGCKLAKCTNREAVLVKLSNSPQSDIAESTLSCSDIVEAEKTGLVAFEGAMLLHRALLEKPAEMNDNRRPRKEPLCDIGNTMTESDALKPGETKKGRKPVIQLGLHPPSSLPENIKRSKREVQADVIQNPLGHMPSVSNSSSSTESVFGQPDEFVASKATVPAPRYPIRQARALNQKENRSL